MVTLDGRIKLIDFGIARIYKKGKPKDTITMGSENYAAPEQWGKAQTDPRADIYSLGATLYHLLTNMPPLPAFVPTPRVAVQTYNPAVTDRTVAVIDKAMAEDPARRYTTALEMREALLACLAAPERRRLEARSAVAAARLRATATAAQAPVPVAATPAPAPRPAAQQPAVTTASANPIAAPSPQYPTVGASTHPTPPGLAAQEYTKPCPRCATLNKPAARFCRACGYTFAPPLPPVLAVVEPLGARWEYPLRGNSVLIGRPGGRLPVDLDLDYYDTQDYVSRNHARVTMDQRRYYVTDVGSGNGTTVNDERLAPQSPRLLRSGDRIRLGQVVLQFRIR
jgi:predicted component of type VI protein secretion system